MANELDALKRVEEAQAAIAETLSAQDSKIGDVSQKLGDELKSRNAAWEAAVKDLRAEYEKAKSETNAENLEIKRRLEDAEIRLGHPGAESGQARGSKAEQKSVGTRFVEIMETGDWESVIGGKKSAANTIGFAKLRALKSSPKFELGMNILDFGRKAITSADATRFVVPFRDQMLDFPMQDLFIRDYMTHIPVSSNAFEYVRHNGTGPETALSMTSISSTGTAATATTAAAHGMRVGSFVQINDSTDTDYNGIFRVLTVPTTTTFTYTMLADPADDSADGTITYRPLSIGGGAAWRAEAATKPLSRPLRELIEGRVQSIAHVEKVSQEVLDDLPQLRAIIDTDLVYNLNLKAEIDAFYGDGTSPNVLGLSNVPGRQTLTQGALSAVDVLRRARSMVALSNFAADLVALNPMDWEAVETKKGSDDHYVLAAGASGTNEGVWRLPVRETNSIKAGDVFVGAFRRGSAVYDRQAASIEFTNANEDDFLKNLIAIRGEARLAYAWKYASAFVQISFTG